jgi:hypothetical protein
MRRLPQLGAFVVPDAGAPEAVLARCRPPRGPGLDLVGIQDHPYQRRFLDNAGGAATPATSADVAAGGGEKLEYSLHPSCSLG